VTGSVIRPSHSSSRAGAARGSGCAIQTLHALAFEMLARAGAPLAGAEALFPVLVRQPKGTQPYPLGDLS
jgi:hypothetical protein